MWIAIPIVVVLLVLGLLAILSGMPFGKKERPVTKQKIAQVKEGQSPPLTGTLGEIGGATSSEEEEGEAQFTILEPNVEGGVTSEDPSPEPAPSRSAPSRSAQTQPAPRQPPPQPPPQQQPVSRPPQPSIRPSRPPAPAPVIREERSVSFPVPAPSRAESPREGEVSEEEAVATLQGFLDARNYYKIDASCVSVSSAGYKNEGYTLDVRDRCDSRPLGRWRVDSKTRELFRQRENGKYGRP